MKIIFTASILLITTSGFAQITPKTKILPLTEKPYHLLAPQKFYFKHDSLTLFKNYLAKQGYTYLGNNIIDILPNNTKIYSLPQDNMPCIVPDLTQFNMPNKLNGTRITGMPPGTAPKKNFPEKKE
jgi:hypothetical protein